MPRNTDPPALTSPSGQSGRHPGCIRLSIWMPVQLHRDYQAALAARASNQTLDMRMHAKRVVAEHQAAVSAAAKKVKG